VKQKKLLVWGIVLAGVMMTVNMFHYLALGIGMNFSGLLFSIVLPAAVCGILAGAVYEKRALGIISSAVALTCETISLINFCTHILGYGFSENFLFSLMMLTVYMAMAALWLLRFIIKRPMKTLLLVVTIVGASLGITIVGVEMLDELVMAITDGYSYRIITNLCSTLSEAAFWTILLLAACGQPRHTAKAVPETVEVFDETLAEPAAETVAAAEEETVFMPVQEASAPSESALDALERLAALRERGILTDAEFESKKAELLSKI